ncbi:MAG TPA: maleylpyruvate isomerase family mycothiol-dependent enzyme [Acidimicrobiales bacterium]|nr:maleylpyruvate isomerase family mycothiol-dependent enzyme [Acidimicrobiales bacterium]
MSADETLMWDEVRDIGSLLHELDDADFDRPSLCEGWKVRDVLGHMGLGHTTPMLAMTGRMARYGFNVTKASFNESKSLFSESTPDEIRRFWDDVMVAGQPRRGISKMIPTSAGFLDHLVHNEDIRRPTGHRRQVPEDRLRRALSLVRTEGSPMWSPKKKVSGLRLQATDIDWSEGEGPVVSGPGESIVMAASGRRAALGELEGDGVDRLRARIGA